MNKFLSFKGFLSKNYSHLNEEYQGLVRLVLISTFMNLYVLGTSTLICWFLEISELVYMFGAWAIFLIIWLIFIFIYSPYYKWIRYGIALESLCITLIPILFYGLGSLFSIYLIIIPLASILLFAADEKRPFKSFLCFYFIILLLLLAWDIFNDPLYSLSQHQTYWINYVIIIGSTGVSFFYSLYFWSENSKYKNIIHNKQQELETLNNTKDQLFSIIAHDLRKPAMSFKGITNRVNYLIQKKDFDTLNKVGNTIEKSAIQLNSLLDNLLFWAISQKDLISIKKETIQVKGITEELINNLSLLSSEKSIKLDDSGIDQNLTIHTDPNILLIILRNLIDNAIKYSEAGSTVFISIKKLEGYVILSVKDTGIGMNQEQINKLFKVYKKKSTAGSYGEKGTGLGLNLVNDLVQKIGGTIECISFPGKGTEIIINNIIDPDINSMD